MSSSLSTIGRIFNALGIFTIIPPFTILHQMLMRIFYFNGSVDKPWLFSMCFFPLNILPILNFEGKVLSPIEPGTGINPLDCSAFLIFFICLFILYQQKTIFEKTKKAGPLILSMMLYITIFIAFYQREKLNCGSCNTLFDFSRVAQNSGLVLLSGLAFQYIIFRLLPKIKINQSNIILQKLNSIIQTINNYNDPNHTGIKSIYQTLSILTALLFFYMHQATHLQTYCQGKANPFAFAIIYIFIFILVYVDTNNDQLSKYISTKIKK